MQRIFSEAKAGTPQFDVTSFAYLPLLAEKGLLARYQSPQARATIKKASSIPPDIGCRCIPI